MSAITDSRSADAAPVRRVRRAGRADRVTSPGARASRASRVWFWLVAVTALGYAPLAINYVWRYIAPGTPQLQAKLTETVVSHSYAVGYGSVDWARASAYMDSRWTLLIHTTLGGLCMILGILQLTPAVRRRWPAVHRWSGRTFMVAMTVSMLTAMLVLLAISPHFFMAPAFYIQLWALALITLTTGWVAFAMIRRRNVVAHRGFMMLCFSFLMTAPLLRVLWIGVLPLVYPKAILLINLGSGAIALAILAPFAAGVAFILTHPARRAGQPHANGRLVYGAGAAVCAVATAAIVLAFYAVPGRHLTEGLLSTLVPLALAVTVTGVMALRAARAGLGEQEHRWRILFAGLAVTPAVMGGAWLLGLTVMSVANAYGTAAMVAAAGPLTLAVAALIYEASPVPLVGLPAWVPLRRAAGTVAAGSAAAAAAPAR